jgi:hypothetical protein
MPLILSDSTLSVEYNDTFQFSFSGATGVVTADVPLLDRAKVTLSVSQTEGEEAGLISGELKKLATTGSTITITVTDTYLDDDEEEQTETATCTISVITDGIVADLDDVEDQNVFDRQQALCNNQVVIAQKINTVRNLIIMNLAVSIGSLADSIARISSMLSDINDDITDLDSRVTTSGKNTVTI